MLAVRGQGEVGIAQIRQSLSAWRATGAETGRPYGLLLLAKAYGKAGRAAEGLRAVDEARQWLAEIYGWFSEGFDTADLREAKRLLEALG